MEVDLVLAQDDLVAARWTTEGTNTGAWGSRPPTGRHAKFSGVNIFRIREGKVVDCGTTGTTSDWRSSSAQRSTRAPHPR
jgi:predicted ester cyclase